MFFFFFGGGGGGRKSVEPMGFWGLRDFNIRETDQFEQDIKYIFLTDFLKSVTLSSTWVKSQNV